MEIAILIGIVYLLSRKGQEPKVVGLGRVRQPSADGRKPTYSLMPNLQPNTRPETPDGAKGALLM